MAFKAICVRALDSPNHSCCALALLLRLLATLALAQALGTLGTLALAQALGTLGTLALPLLDTLAVALALRLVPGA